MCGIVKGGGLQMAISLYCTPGLLLIKNLLLHNNNNDSNHTRLFTD